MGAEGSLAVNVDNLTVKLLDVLAVPTPAPIANRDSLKQLFAAVSTRFQLEVFLPTPEGGAILSSPVLQRQFVVAPAARQAQFSVTISAARTRDEIVEIFREAQDRVPVPQYLATQISITSHLPVTGETASDVMDRCAFSRRDAFELLGPGRIGAGIKVFMRGIGQLSIAVEPLLADPGVLFVNLVQVRPEPLDVNQIQQRIDDLLRYHDNQAKEFLRRLLQENVA